MGRLASSLLGGWVAEKTSYAFAFESSLTINLIGSLLYFFADELGLWAAILGRVLVGFGSGEARTLSDVSMLGSRSRRFHGACEARYATIP